LSGEPLEQLAELTLQHVLRRHPTLSEDEQEFSQVKLALGWYTMVKKPGRKQTRLSVVRGIMGPWLGVDDFDDCMQSANQDLGRMLAQPNPTSKRQQKRLARAR
jgi:hypothetical protein